MPTAFEKLKLKSQQTTAPAPTFNTGSFAPGATQETAPTPAVSAFDKLKTKSTTVPSVATPPANDSGGAVESLVKGVVSAPATLLARPLQAAQSAGQILGSNTEELAKLSAENHASLTKLIQLRRDKLARGEDVTHLSKAINDITKTEDSAAKELSKQGNFKPTSGGIVAPAPQNAADVKKDVGRGIETVALGTGAPIAGGAAYGFGSSLEQGNDVLSAQTALQTVVGAGAGKALELLGKPLLDAAGKVIGTITPLDLKNIAAQGAGAVERFIAQHEIVPAAVKPAINAIPDVAQAVDTGVGNLFKGGKSAVGGVIKEQYPNADLAKHYQKIETDRMIQPTKVPGPTFKNASKIAADAERRGINIQQLMQDNKIYATDHISEGKFSTADTVNALRDETVGHGAEILRPALTSAEETIPKVPISEVRSEMLAQLKKVPDATLSPEQKLDFAKKIRKEYGDGSITAQKYADGYSLTNLYDSKLQTTSGLYKPKMGVQTISDSLIAKQKQIESKAFQNLLMDRAPKELGLDKYFKAQEGRFILADYLNSLDTKKAPQSLFQRAVKRTAQLGGATAGAQTAGPFGMFSGYQFGGIMADTFNNASNPVKVAYLKSIGKTEPEIYAIMRQYVAEGPARTFSRVSNTKALPAAPNVIITPNRQGTPNKISSLYKAGGDEGAVGGLRQRKTQ